MTTVERYVLKAKKNVGSQKVKLDQKDKRNEIIEKLEAARLLTGELNAKVCRTVMFASVIYKKMYLKTVHRRV